MGVILASEPPSGVIAIDTETTGLGPDAEILQCSIISGTGDVLFNRHFRPEAHDSWPEAEAVNGISPRSVAGCPPFRAHAAEISAILARAEAVVGYNLPFDLGMLGRGGVGLPPLGKCVDVMVPFAEIYGERRPGGGFKWQRLQRCAKWCGWDGAGWHDSLADCRATIFCFWKILGIKGELPALSEGA